MNNTQLSLAFREMDTVPYIHQARPTYVQVALVAYKHDRHIRVGMLPRILQPACQVVERLSPGSGDNRERVSECAPGTQPISG